MSRPSLPILLLALATGGCMAGDRRIEAGHQPIVANGVASVPGCPDWSDGGRIPREAQSSNFGCASRGNLAAMIADPEDLLRGRTAEGSRAEVATKALKAWREAEPTGKSWTVTARESVGGPK